MSGDIVREDGPEAFPFGRIAIELARSHILPNIRNIHILCFGFHQDAIRRLYPAIRSVRDKDSYIRRY